MAQIVVKPDKSDICGDYDIAVQYLYTLLCNGCHSSFEY